MENNFDYKRYHQRKNYQTDIIFAHENRAYNGILLNVSIGGAFIATRDVHKVRNRDIVTITIPYTDRKKNVRRQGVVKWKNNEGFAIEFM
jgi:hypothetical protein